MFFSLQTILPFFKDILYVIGLLVYARMLNIYGKHKTDQEINTNFILIGFIILASSIGTYLSLYMKYVLKLKPSKQITPDRWFTVAPSLHLLIVSGFFFSIITFILGLWPVYHVYGAIFCVLSFIVLRQITSYPHL